MAPPPGPAYAPPPPYGAPAPAPAAPAIPAAVLNDPHGLGMAVGRLGNSTRKATRAAMTAAAVLLTEGEVVECIVGGQAQGANAVCLLTNKRLLLVSDREWKPDVLEVPVDSSVTVQGWQDERTASLVIQRNQVAAQVERIGDRAIAMELAQRIRARAAGTG